MMCLKHLGHSGPIGASIYEQWLNKEMRMGNFSRRIRSYRGPDSDGSVGLMPRVNRDRMQEKNVRARQSLTTEGIWV